MTTPGIYEGMAMADYLAAEAVSASLLTTLLDRCPLAAWHDSWLNPHRSEDDSGKLQNAGTIAHGILLEGSMERVAVIDPNDHPAEKTGAIPEGWTNKSIKAARTAAIAAGKTPVLISQMGEIEAMVAKAREFIESLREAPEDDLARKVWAAFQPGGGKSEVTMVWDEGEVRCRIRPDRITADCGLIIDYKTGGTSAEPDTWGRTQMVKMGYYTSAALYRRGVEALCGKRPDYVFLVQEQEAPYLCSLVGIDPQGYELGDDKIRRALKDWTECMRSGQWPAYPNRVCYAEIPPWETVRWEEALAHKHEIPYDIAKIGWDKAKPKLGFEHEHDPI